MYLRSQPPPHHLPDALFSFMDVRKYRFPTTQPRKIAALAGLPNRPVLACLSSGVTLRLPHRFPPLLALPHKPKSSLDPITLQHFSSKLQNFSKHRLYNLTKRRSVKYFRKISDAAVLRQSGLLNPVRELNVPRYASSYRIQLGCFQNHNFEIFCSLLETCCSTFHRNIFETTHMIPSIPLTYISAAALTLGAPPQTGLR
jgi:hypothetical protein